MAAKTLPLEELKGATVAELFAFSGSKLVEQGEWINQQLDEIAQFPSDTLNKKGHLVRSMVELFEKTDRKEKTKAVCSLAGRLWFAHEHVYEQNIDTKKGLAQTKEKLSEVEEELLIVVTEKNELAEQVARLQVENEKRMNEPSENGSEKSESFYQLRSELERVRAENYVCHDQMENLKKVNKGHVNTLYELQAQAREATRHNETDQRRIQDLEAALRRGTPQNPPNCDGSCKDKIKHFEADLRKANEIIETLKDDIQVETDRYWDASDAIHDREIHLAQREGKISRLEQDKDILIKQINEVQCEIKELKARLTVEKNRKTPSGRPLTPELGGAWAKPDPAEPYEGAGSHKGGDTDRKTRKESLKEDQRKRPFRPYQPSSDDESDPERDDKPRRGSKDKKEERCKPNKPRQDELPHASARTIKSLRGMLPSFSKTNKTGSILEHLTLYQRLMTTLEMDSDIELKTYLSWTFATDSQSFFMSVGSGDHETWAEYRCEVIKQFSPHRNSHEALRYALNVKCENNQHPRDYLQLLKNAFAQVQKEVNMETKQFKDAYFYGLPKHIRTQLARDYDDDRSIDWIYRQAKSIYDVSRTEETTEAKDKPKPSKVCELGKEKDLSFETGGNKPRPAPKEKEGKKAQEQKAPEKPPKNPEGRDVVSSRYRGNNPLPNFVYRPKDNSNDSRTGGERERPRENERNEREPYRPQGRDRNAPDSYRQEGYDRPEYQPYRRDNRDYRDWQDTRPYAENRERYQPWDERPRSPRQPTRLTVLEGQIKDLTQHYRNMAPKDSGPSPRVHATSTNELNDRDTPRTGQ